MGGREGGREGGEGGRDGQRGREGEREQERKREKEREREREMERDQERAYAHARGRVRKYISACLHLDAYMCMHMHTQKRTYMSTNIQLGICVLCVSRSNVFISACSWIACVEGESSGIDTTLARTHLRTYARTNPPTHARTHAHTHAHTHARLVTDEATCADCSYAKKRNRSPMRRI